MKGLEGIKLIACAGMNWEIGRANGLIWHIPKDLEAFRRATEGSAIIMGRKTYESIGKPLPGRRNIVVSGSMVYKPGIEVFSDIDTALAATGFDCFVLGGQKLYSQCMNNADYILLTRVFAECEGADRFFPVIPKIRYERVMRTEILCNSSPPIYHELYTKKTRAILTREDDDFIRHWVGPRTLLA